MSEWWTYRPGDFLMFSPRVYARLFESVNEAWWPLHLVLLPAGLLGLWALVRGRARVALAVGCSASWLLCLAVFVQARYQPINWAAGYLVLPLCLLAALLPLLAWHTRDLAAVDGPTRHVAWGLAAWALLLHPLLAPLTGRGWWQAEVVGLAPDPGAIATLAFLLALPPQPGVAWRVLALLAWLLVLAWCGFNGFMLAAMENLQAGVLIAAAALAVAVRLKTAASSARARAGLRSSDPAGPEDRL
jgi:hypothetical protein